MADANDSEDFMDQSDKSAIARTTDEDSYKLSKVVKRTFQQLDKKGYVWASIIFFIFGALGILVGYYSANVVECEPEPMVQRDFVTDEVSIENIKRNLLWLTATDRFSGSDGDKSVALELKTMFEENGLEDVHLENFKVPLPYTDKANPNRVEILRDGRVVFTAKSVSMNDGTPYENPFVGFSKRIETISNWSMTDPHMSLDDYTTGVRIHSVESKLGWKLFFHILNFERKKNNGTTALLIYEKKIDHRSRFNITKNPIRYSAWVNWYGDLTTPGYPSIKSMFRLHNLTSSWNYMPIQIIGREDAEYIMNNYMKTGTKPKPLIRVVINNVIKQTPLYNVIGHFKGSVEPDRYIIIGSNRDGWMESAMFSGSGTSMLIEIIRLLGELKKQGWRPRRTIIFLSWSGGSEGLVGFVEHVENKFKEYHEKAVAYIDISRAVTGNETLVPTVHPLLMYVIRKSMMKTLDERHWKQSTFRDSPIQSVNTTTKKEKEKFGDYEFYAKMRSGSSYSNGLFREYLDSVKRPSYLKSQYDRYDVEYEFSSTDIIHFFLGVPTVDLDYIFHSDEKNSEIMSLVMTQHDTYNFVSTYVDPTFKCHATVVKLVVELLRSLSEDSFLPYSFLEYYKALDGYSEKHKDYFLHSYETSSEVFATRLNSTLGRIKEFKMAALEFHSKQDGIRQDDWMKVRRINDVLSMASKTFASTNMHPRIFVNRIIKFSTQLESMDLYDAILPEVMSIFHPLRFFGRLGDDQSMKQVYEALMSIGANNIRQLTNSLKL
ncbi:Uncharacterised protein g9675 [Pycnogonum litorale]